MAGDPSLRIIPSAQEILPTLGSGGILQVNKTTQNIFQNLTGRYSLKLSFPLDTNLRISPRSTTKDLSELGDSSSLFTFNSTASFEFGSAIKSTGNNCPIPFVFGVSKEANLEPEQIRQTKMVNERSPAKATKAPLNPVMANEQPPKQSESSYPFKALQSNVPQFGQPTLPQSPLNRAPARESSSVFIQPKSRPEHHRDGDKSGIRNLVLLIALKSDLI